MSWGAELGRWKRHLDTPHDEAHITVDIVLDGFRGVGRVGGAEALADGGLHLANCPHGGCVQVHRDAILTVCDEVAF